MSTAAGNRPVIGVAVLVWHKQKVLLGERISHGENACWQFPGGHLEAGETVIDCARREVHEETGLLVEAFRHLGYTDQSFVVGQKNYLTLFVSCISHSSQARIMEPDKCAGWSWFDDTRLPQPLFEPISLFLQQQKPPGSAVSLYELHCCSPQIPGVSALL